MDGKIGVNPTERPESIRTGMTGIRTSGAAKALESVLPGCGEKKGAGFRGKTERARPIRFTQWPLGRLASGAKLLKMKNHLRPSFAAHAFFKPANFMANRAGSGAKNVSIDSRRIGQRRENRTMTKVIG